MQMAKVLALLVPLLGNLHILLEALNHPIQSPRILGKPKYVSQMEERNVSGKRKERSNFTCSCRST